MRRTNLITQRYHKIGTWDAQRFGRLYYNTLLFQDFQINRYLTSIYYRLQYPMSEVLISRHAVNRIVIETTVFIPLFVTLSLLYFNRRVLGNVCLYAYRLLNRPRRSMSCVRAPGARERRIARFAKEHLSKKRTSRATGINIFLLLVATHRYCRSIELASLKRTMLRFAQGLAARGCPDAAGAYARLALYGNGRITCDVGEMSGSICGQAMTGREGIRHAKVPSNAMRYAILVEKLYRHHHNHTVLYGRVRHTKESIYALQHRLVRDRYRYKTLWSEDTTKGYLLLCIRLSPARIYKNILALHKLIRRAHRLAAKMKRAEQRRTWRRIPRRYRRRYEGMKRRSVHRAQRLLRDSKNMAWGQLHPSIVEYGRYEKRIGYGPVRLGQIMAKSRKRRKRKSVRAPRRGDNRRKMLGRLRICYATNYTLVSRGLRRSRAKKGISWKKVPPYNSKKARRAPDYEAVAEKRKLGAARYVLYQLVRRMTRLSMVHAPWWSRSSQRVMAATSWRPRYRRTIRRPKPVTNARHEELTPPEGLEEWQNERLVRLPYTRHSETLCVPIVAVRLRLLHTLHRYVDSINKIERYVAAYERLLRGNARQIPRFIIKRCIGCVVESMCDAGTIRLARRDTKYITSLTAIRDMLYKARRARTRVGKRTVVTSLRHALWNLRHIVTRKYVRYQYLVRKGRLLGRPQHQLRDLHRDARMFLERIKPRRKRRHWRAQYRYKLRQRRHSDHMVRYATRRWKSDLITQHRLNIRDTRAGYFEHLFRRREELLGIYRYLSIPGVSAHMMNRYSMQARHATETVQTSLPHDHDESYMTPVPGPTWWRRIAYVWNSARHTSTSVPALASFLALRRKNMTTLSMSHMLIVFARQIGMYLDTQYSLVIAAILVGARAQRLLRQMEGIAASYRDMMLLQGRIESRAVKEGMRAKILTKINSTALVKLHMLERHFTMHIPYYMRNVSYNQRMYMYMRKIGTVSAAVWWKRVIRNMTLLMENTLCDFLGQRVVPLVNYHRDKRRKRQTLVGKKRRRRFRARFRGYRRSQLRKGLLYKKYYQRLQKKYTFVRKRMPAITSPQFVCDFFRQKIEYGYRAFRVFKEFRRWQNTEIYRVKRYEHRYARLIYVWEKRYPFNGIRIRVAGPSKRGRRKRQAYYHLWVRLFENYRRMPLQTIDRNIEYAQCHVRRRVSEMSVKVWLLFRGLINKQKREEYRLSAHIVGGEVRRV